MQDINNQTDLENRVLPISTKNYKTMMLAPEGMTLLNKNVPNGAEFRLAVEKGGLLTGKTQFSPDKLKSITVEKGELKMKLNARKVVQTSIPADLDFVDENQLNEVLDYMEKKWYFQRTEQPLSSFKAIVPYLIGLAVTLFLTGLVIYMNAAGGTYRMNVILILLVKLSGAIGFIPTVLLGLLISGVIIRELMKAYKNPPVEIRLEPRS